MKQVFQSCLIVFLFLSFSFSTTMIAEEGPKDQASEIAEWHLGGLVFRKYIKIKVIHDPKVRGIICHYAYIEKKLSLEDPSNASIACRQTGPIYFAKDFDPKGESIFEESRDPFFKNFHVRRNFDKANQVLIYTSYTKELIDGSNKLSISTIVLDHVNGTF